MSAIDVFPEACANVSSVIQDAATADLTRSTPCGDFNLQHLVHHFTGTTSALARIGVREPLDAADPWGAGTTADPARWASGLVSNLDALARAWAAPTAWLGSVDTGGGEMPAPVIGEMALAEVVLHGWDLARATGQHLVVGPELGAELRRMVEETGELGRQLGAYGPAVQVGDEAGDLERALAASGRDPDWRR